MFEKYQCAGVYIAIQAVLTLYAQGTLKSHDYHMITPYITKVSSSYGTLGETKVLVGVTTVEVEQVVVERQMLATNYLSKASWLYKATVASSFAQPHIYFVLHV